MAEGCDLADGRPSVSGTDIELLSEFAPLLACHVSSRTMGKIKMERQYSFDVLCAATHQWVDRRCDHHSGAG